MVALTDVQAKLLKKRNSYKSASRKMDVVKQPTSDVINAKSLLGAAAEHYVMSQLLRRGKLAALAPIGMPFADIIVSDHLGSALSAIQVKARTHGADGGWQMSVKHEEVDQAFVLYCFVDFTTSLTAQPKCWVVPSGVVARALVASYKAWLSKPGKNGKAHKDHDMRRFRRSYSDLDLPDYGDGWLNDYEDAWSLIATSVEPA